MSKLAAMPLAVILLVASVEARSDNSLANLLSMGNIDYLMSLEQQAASTPSNDMAANEIDDNKIRYTRHSGSNWDDEEEEGEDDYDDCPTCFEEIGEGIMQEWGQRARKARNSRRGYIDGVDDNMHHKRKDGVGEAIMSDMPIRSESGRGGRSSFGGQGSPRSFSFNTDDIRRSPTARHYETKGHRFRYDHADEAVNETQEEVDPLDGEKDLGEEKVHKHRHRHHHHRSNKKNDMVYGMDDPYERHRAYQDHFLVMEQHEEHGEPLSEHETQQMDFYLENGLLLLAEQIAQDQKDLYAIEELQYKGQNSENGFKPPANEVQRHDFSDIPLGEENNAELAQKQASNRNKMKCTDEGVCQEDETSEGEPSLASADLVVGLATLAACLVALN